MASSPSNESDPGSSSSASKLPCKNKNKEIIRPLHVTSLRSLAELLTFRSLISPPTKSNHQKFLSYNDSQAAPSRAFLSSSSSSSSAIVINNNEDLLIQILLFLPPKSLIRFLCVSKQWFALISSPHFRCLHARKKPATASNAAAAGLFMYRRIFENSELNDISLRKDDSNPIGTIASRCTNFLNMEGEIFAFHTCNGLIFIDFYWNYEIRRYYVYNPTTNQSRLIAQPHIDGKSQVKAVNIVFDPLKSREYRLVCVLSKQLEGVQMRELCFFAYSSEAGVWKECIDVDIERRDTFYNYYHFSEGVYCKGNLYWKNPYRSLRCFDLERNCVRQMEITETEESRQRLSRSSMMLYFGESGGNLHLIELYEPQSSGVYISELEMDSGLGTYHSRWLLKYRVDIGWLEERYPLIVDERIATNAKEFIFGIPCFLEDKKENKAKLMISLRGKIFL